MDIYSRLDALPDSVRRHILDAIVGPPRPSPTSSEPPATSALSAATCAAARHGGPQPPKPPAAPAAVPGLKLVGGACVVDGFLSPDLVEVRALTQKTHSAQCRGRWIQPITRLGQRGHGMGEWQAKHARAEPRFVGGGTKVELQWRRHEHEAVEAPSRASSDGCGGRGRTCPGALKGRIACLRLKPHHLRSCLPRSGIHTHRMRGRRRGRRSRSGTGRRPLAGGCSCRARAVPSTRRCVPMRALRLVHSGGQGNKNLWRFPPLGMSELPHYYTNYQCNMKSLPYVPRVLCASCARCSRGATT